MFDARTNQGARPIRRGLTALAIPIATMVGLAPRAAADPAAVAPPAAPAGASAVAYAGDVAYVSWEAAPGEPSDDFVVAAQLVTPSGAQVVSSQTAAGTDTIVTGLATGDTYTFSVEATNAAGNSAAAITSPIQAVGAVPPGPPTGLSLTASAQDNEATISWNPPLTSPAPEWYNIGVFEGTATSQTQVGAVGCYAPCTSKRIELDPGTVASVHVSASDTAGMSSYAFSNWISVTQPCPLACVAVDATIPGAQESHPASGFLHAIGPKTSTGALAGVGPLHWRVSQAWNSQVEESRAAAAGADLTEILSDDWLATHNVGGYAQFPWTDWSVYQQWVTSEVQTIEAQGRAQGFSISYWEVQNEPGAGYYYSASATPPPSVTVANNEQQFLVAYRAIKAADPNAKVVSPSLMAWASNPSAANGGLDMRTFLDFCVFNGIAPDAIAFHDNQTAPLFDEFAPNYEPSQPASIVGQVAQLRAMLAARPSLGSPDILINEYGSPGLSQLPGWDVGYIAALEAAGVNEADRSCWSTCTDGSLDGLLAGDGATTLPSYWVYDLYAAMTGERLPVTTSFTDVTGLATVNSSGTIQVLLGRHQGCNTATSSTCPAAPPAPATITVRVPFGGNASVTSALVPAGSGALDAPVAQPGQTVPIAGGVATIATPALSDGDAIEITVSPGPGSYPAPPATTVTSVAGGPGAVVVGQPATYTATVSSSAPGASGTVTFDGIAGTLCTSPVDPSTGISTCTTTYGAADTDSVTANYSGDTAHAASTSSPTTVTIGPDGTTVSVNADTVSAVVGKPITFTATVAPVDPGTSVPTGTVTITTAGGSLCTAALNGSSPDQAVCSAAVMTAGSAAVTATYSGSPDDTAAASAPLAIAVSASPTTASVTTSDPAPVVGEAVTLSATVAAASPGAGTPTGAVTFVGTAGPLCSAPLDQAAPDRATCTTTYPATGSDSVTAVYSGDDNDVVSSSLPVQVSIQPAATATMLAGPSTGVVGQPITYTATVTTTAPGSGTPVGTVTFSDSAGVLCTSTLGSAAPAKGTCSTRYATPAYFNVTATFGGSANFTGSETNAVTHITAATTTTRVAATPLASVTGQTVTFVATVTANAPSTAVPAGQLTFTVDTAAGRRLTCTAGNTVALKSGRATCSIAGRSLSPSVAPLLVVATYAGAAGTLASRSYIHHAIGASYTSLTVASSRNPSPPTGALTFTATVKAASPGTGTPSGSVTFKFSTGSYACSGGDVVALNSYGVAACKVLGSIRASFTVSAAYKGSTAYRPSTGSRTQTIT